MLVKQISTYALNLQFHHIHIFPCSQSWGLVCGGMFSGLGFRRLGVYPQICCKPFNLGSAAIAQVIK